MSAIAPQLTRFEDRVRFRSTGAVGTIILNGHDHPWNLGDNSRLWHRVRFDDGLECWCVEDSLEFLTVLGWV